jgi:hypothetical protein
MFYFAIDQSGVDRGGNESFDLRGGDAADAAGI